ncbi:SDR family oxidoreductase [Microvirga rosea]|uniref:SDR family oxidoreductase n=1 Tax=Microvirga rosea TaxID=2715425 RepID=UPI001D0B2AEF|nr:SDR family NAD(P)-dependent oxidoreductase [Microvirga rosea]MCB8821896.1 SDR family oxidoreductase [Microvirga rosea]
MELEGKVALITGAGSGIGKAAALRLAREGAAVGALSHTESEVRQTVEEIERHGGKAMALVADVADEQAMRNAVDALTGAYGRLDIVFANAGINGVWAPIDDLKPQEWDQTIATNLRGTYLTLHYAVPHLKKAGGGSILITASINGTRTFTSAGATAYSATKAAQVAMAQMLALELAKHRIRVNAICPGKIDTRIPDNTHHRNTQEAQVPAEYPDGDIPLTGGEAGTSDEVADLVLFLVSERARHVTGTPVWIDGGQSLLV